MIFNLYSACMHTQNKVFWFCTHVLRHVPLPPQETLCSSFCVSSAWCSCTGTTTLRCYCTPGTPTESKLQEDAGSSPWTTPCTRSCTATTRPKRPECAFLGPAPLSSPPSRLYRWLWAWLSWRFCTAGRMTRCAGPRRATSSGALSCISATCCCSLPSSTTPTWKEGRRTRPGREELKLNSVCWSGVDADFYSVSLISCLSVWGLNYGVSYTERNF